MVDGSSLRDSNLAYRRPELYDEMTADDGMVATVAAIVEEYGVQPCSVLDVGCGTGRHVAALGERFDASAVGVDLQAQLVDYGRRRYGADLRVGDMRSVRLGRCFDLITCLGNSLAYLHTQEELLTAARTLRTHAHEGSLVVIATLVSPMADGVSQVVRIDTGLLAATVEIESEWDPRKRLQITRRMWRHDDGTEDADVLRRRVVDLDELRSILRVAGFTDMRAPDLAQTAVACTVAIP